MLLFVKIRAKTKRVWSKVSAEVTCRDVCHHAHSGSDPSPVRSHNSVIDECDVCDGKPSRLASILSTSAPEDAVLVGKSRVHVDEVLTEMRRAAAATPSGGRKSQGGSGRQEESVCTRSSVCAVFTKCNLSARPSYLASHNRHSFCRLTLCIGVESPSKR